MEKVVLVTGASSGIGRAAATRLAAGGWSVYAAARRSDRLQELATLGVRPVELDLTLNGSIELCVESVIERSGRLDAVVNNAGYGSYGAIEDVPLDEARRQFEVNVFGLARLVQLVVPHMRRQGSGRIVNVTSVGGRVHEPLGGWYHATKFAVEGLSDCLRMELEPFGINVSVVQPGAIRTEWGQTAIDTLLTSSGQTHYSAQTRQRVAVLRLADSPRVGSDPAVVAEVIARALNAQRPRTRYATGRGARFLLGYRWLASDRCFDWLMRLMAKYADRQAGPHTPI